MCGCRARRTAGGVARHNRDRGAAAHPDVCAGGGCVTDARDAEGPGLYAATSGGAFQSVSGDVHVTNDVLADAHRPGWVYAAQLVSGNLVGGVYASSAGGIGLSPIGLTGKSISVLAMNSAGTELYAVSYGEGIYKATLPTR